MADVIEQNLEAIRASIEGATPVVRGVVKNSKPEGWKPSHDDPLPGMPIDGVEAGLWKPDGLGLPPNCPVRPLGVSGDICYFVDPIGQVRELAPPMGKTHILTLFSGRAGYLTWGWPRWGKDRTINGFAADEVAASLIKACHELGPWSYVDKTRGRGCWLDDENNIVLHLGTRLVHGQLIVGPSEKDGYVYAARPPIPGPAGVKTPAIPRPAAEVLLVFANRLPMMHRDGWTGKRATSQETHAWFVWDRAHKGDAIIKRIAWEPLAAAKEAA